MGKRTISIEIYKITGDVDESIEFRTIMSSREYSEHVNRAIRENLINCRRILDNENINFSPDSKIIDRLRYVYEKSYLEKSKELRDILENMEDKNKVLPRFQVNLSTFELCLCIEQLQVHYENATLKCSIYSSFNEGCPCSREKCQNVSSLTCTGCLSIRYCSKECQNEDWNEHKLTCICSKHLIKN